MKTLFLIRHAKSSWDDTALPDKDRPLADRGRRDAPKMGKRLAKRDVKPDLILSSPARRALTTAEIVAKKLDYKLKISWWMIGCMPARCMTCSTSFTRSATSWSA